jgi:hypothetical protein
MNFWTVWVKPSKKIMDGFAQNRQEPVFFFFFFSLLFLSSGAPSRSPPESRNIHRKSISSGHHHRAVQPHQICYKLANRRLPLFLFHSHNQLQINQKIFLDNHKSTSNNQKKSKPDSFNPSSVSLPQPQPTNPLSQINQKIYTSNNQKRRRSKPVSFNP